MKIRVLKELIKDLPDNMETVKRGRDHSYSRLNWVSVHFAEVEGASLFEDTEDPKAKRVKVLVVS